MPLYNPVTASGVSGLGTAAVKNTGTSGDAVPVLNGAAPTWTNGSTFGGTVTASVANGATAGFSTVDVANRSVIVSPSSGATGKPTIGSLSADDVDLVRANVTLVRLVSGGIDVTGLAQCDSFRIDVAPTAEVVVCTHTVAFNANGTAYKFPCILA